VIVHIGQGTGGRGDGTFSGGTNVAVGTGDGHARASVITDFNGDGRPDIFATTQNTTRLLYFKAGGSDGRGDGSFALDSGVAVTGITDLVTADFNNDEVPDFATSAGDIVLGGGGADGPPGDETLKLVGTYGVSGANGLLVADFNSDKIIDIAFAGTGGLVLLLGNGGGGRGDGTFSEMATPISAVARQPRAGDFNADGLLDILVVAGDTLQVLEGTGGAVVPNGAFLPASENYQAFSDVIVTALGDINDDQLPDYLHTILNQNGAPPMYIWLGNGTNGQGAGTFSLRGQLPTGRFTQMLGIADLDEDGAPDVMMGNSSQGAGNNLGDVIMAWGVLSEGHASGSFDREAVVLAGNQSHFVQVFADFDDDGALDVALGTNPPALTIARNAATDGRGVRAWETHTTHAVSSVPKDIALGDFNSDGVTDAAVTCESAGTVEVLLGVADGTGPGGGRGDGTFGAASIVANALTNPRKLATGDFDGDGITDLVIATSQTVEVLLGDGSAGHGDGTFTGGASLTGFGNLIEMELADFDGDHLPDLLLVDAAGGVRQTYVYTGSGSGSFALHDTLVTTDREGVPQVADLDNDGTLDVVIGTQYDVFRVFAGDGTSSVVAAP